MKFVTVFIFCTILALLLFPINGIASSLDKLPSFKTSNQWEVVIDKPDNNDIESNPVFNVYSMDIIRNGDEDIKILRVEAYRDEPNSLTDFELFTVNYEKEKDMDLQPSFHHQNFPISAKAKNLKVIITWKKPSDSSRLFKEEFVFHQ